MKTKLYFLEIVYYVETDKEDNERVEYRLGDSFWCNRRKLQHAKKGLLRISTKDGGLLLHPMTLF